MVVDTNVLVYAADDSALVEQEPCRALLQRLATEPTPWYLTWNIAYEFLRVVTHPHVLRRPRSTAEAWHFVEALVQTGGCQWLTAGPRHIEVVQRLVRQHGDVVRGNLWHDAHTVALMNEHGIRRIATRDSDLHRFRSIEVIDPLLPDAHA